MLQSSIPQCWLSFLHSVRR